MNAWNQVYGYYESLFTRNGYNPYTDRNGDTWYKLAAYLNHARDMPFTVTLPESRQAHGLCYTDKMDEKWTNI
jgi:hypothetical protein